MNILCKLLLVTCIFALSACSTKYPNSEPVGEKLPNVIGTSLSGKKWTIPKDFQAPHTLLIVAFKHKTQFDVDRWLIGLDMKEIKLPVYELPATQGFIPKLFAKQFDSSMRDGIPKNIWKDVITLYSDGEVLQKFTGNQKPKNARVILINAEGKILYFYDRGFSVAALNKLEAVIQQ